jgi:hypothetical protein
MPLNAPSVSPPDIGVNVTEVPPAPPVTPASQTTGPTGGPAATGSSSVPTGTPTQIGQAASGSGAQPPTGSTQGASTSAFQQATPVKPPDINVSAQPMSPTTKVGSELAKFVLWITAGSIAVFVIYLALMEWLVASNVHDAYKRVLNPDRVGVELIVVSEVEKFSADLIAARKTSTAQWSTESNQNAQKVLALVDELPSIGADKKAHLKECNPPPQATDTAREQKIDTCVEIATAIKQSMLAAVAATSDARVAAESAQKIGDQRQGLHTFWVQAAQLVLLNLLLPLLTALFGYIFGTQQGSKPTS